MSYQPEYNARSLPAADVAKSFIPPESHFMRLLTRGHTLLLGPRGSGKTTLLKMLTVRALQIWRHPKAEEYSRLIQFNSAFVPADIAWGKQISSFGSVDYLPRRAEAAFVVHTLRSLVRAMREAVDLGKNIPPAYLEHLAIFLSADQENQCVEVISKELNLTPLIKSLLGLELALDAKLNEIRLNESVDLFTADSLLSKLSFIISVFNGLSKQEERRWALLFDEMEIAPAKIKQFLLAGIRSFDERVIVKLAMAPYMDDAGFDSTPSSAFALHDYDPIQLSYANKDDAFNFSEELFIKTFNSMGVGVESLTSFFQNTSEHSAFGVRRTGKSPIPIEFRELYEKDSSFAKYVQSRKIFEKTYKFSETNVAKDIRKVLPIVYLRNFYLKKFDDGNSVINRSRKSNSLYVGHPSIIEIAEGNPRAILTMVAPLAREFREAAAGGEGRRGISVAAQGRAIRRVELLLTSLLQVIPMDLQGFNVAKGLLDFVDKIGRAFEDRLLKEPFVPDYVGTFVLDDAVSDSVVAAVGKALNAGALVHVPYSDSGPDSLLRGLRGQRFRLSYALASRYRLLLTLGERVNLSRLLRSIRSLDLPTTDSLPLFSLWSGDD